jgi:hypothetical protein
LVFPAIVDTRLRSHSGFGLGGQGDLRTLIIHGDDDQIVPIAGSALLSSRIVRH